MSATCCFTVPIQAGVIVVSVLGVLTGGAFSTIYARNIFDGQIFPADDGMFMTAVPYIGIASWMVLGMLSFYGCWASWVAKPRWVSVYFWCLLAHYILDLVILVATFFVIIRATAISKTRCMDDAGRAGFTNVDGLCPSTMGVATVLFLAALAFFKLLSSYTTYAVFQYKRFVSEKAADEEALRVQSRAPQKALAGSKGNTNWSKFDD